MVVFVLGWRLSTVSRLVGTPNIHGVGFPSSVKFETLKSAMIYITPLFCPAADRGERDETWFSK